MSNSLYALLPLLAIVLVSIRARSRKPTVPFPPGPKSLPIVGSLFSFPKASAWLTFAEWGREYGDVTYANVLGEHIIILNSHQACVDLLEKRSAIYSDRPYSVMLTELLAVDWAFTAMPYSARWRQHRRIFHQFFNEKASKDYLGTQERCVQSFLLRLLDDPSNFLDHTRLLFGEAALDVVYGIKTKSHNDKWIRSIEEFLNAITQAFIPGRYLVNALPFLKYLPSWLPGVGFHKHAIKGKALGKTAKDAPAEYALKRAELMDECSQSTLFSRIRQLSQKHYAASQQPMESPVELATSIGATIYVSGAETTVATTHILFLAMANNPGVQKAAQLELDKVVGHDRLPTFHDLEDLPYINAVIREVLRWHPVVPSGVAHRVTQDDIYQGRLIPKGSIIVPNTWGILHNPEEYPDPGTFNPQRWLVDTPNGVKLSDDTPYPDAAFGFGRRVCPGRYFGQNALFLTISMVLACFNILPLDPSGKPCEKLPELFTDGITSWAEPYQASFVPRSEKVLQLLKEFGA